MISPLAALGAVAHPSLRVVCSAGLTVLLAACNQATLQQASFVPPSQPQYAALSDGVVRIPAVEAETIDPKYVKQRVRYATSQPPGTMVVDPYAKFLYLVQEGGFAMRYGVGVGRDGFGWSGTADIRRKAQWPTWTPPSAMVARQPELEAVQCRDARRDRKSTRCPRPLSLPERPGHALPHPRHQRAREHRQKRIERMHPAFESGRDRSVQSRAGRLQGRCSLRAGGSCGGVRPSGSRAAFADSTVAHCRSICCGRSRTAMAEMGVSGRKSHAPRGPTAGSPEPDPRFPP